MGTVLITGGHKGLGLEAAKRIAIRGSHDILLAGRDMDEVAAVACDLSAKYRIKAKPVFLDVSSLESTRQASTAVKQLVTSGETSPVEVLMLNAGAQFAGPVQYSVDGFELTFATNCLGHFLLLNLLADDILEGGRIVFTASGTHDPDTMDGKMVGKVAEADAVALANDGRAGKPLPWGVRYSTSKLCTMLYAYELDRRLRAKGSTIQSVAFDPGLIVETGLSRTAPALAQRISRTALVKWMLKSLGVTMGSVGFSGDALARVAVDNGFAHAAGKYIQSKNGKLLETRSSLLSYDEGRARRLWSDTELLVGLTTGERARRF